LDASTSLSTGFGISIAGTRVGNSVTRAKHALSIAEGSQRRQEQQTRSTKSEFETISNAQKSENSKPNSSNKRFGFSWRLGSFGFGFVSDFDIRISDFY
jgi:hypothetical protein